MPVALAKLTPPRVGRVVPRERLYRSLDAALDASAVWVGAPAGSGKTTAIADYLTRRKTPLVWYRVDAGDLDLAAFFHSLAQSLSAKERRKPLPVFGPEYAEQPEAFARRFFRAYFSRFPAGTVLVLDDLQAASATLLPDVIAVAIDELPVDFRLFVLSREEVPAAFVRLRANDRLVRLDGRALIFDDGEAAGLIRKLVGEAVDAGAQRRVQEKARGWAAGLVLLSEQAMQNIDPGSRALDEGGQTLFDYFAREVFERMTEPERHFMQLTALLSEVTPQAAMRLTGRDDASAVLDALCRRQLFVTRLGDKSPIYRYHDLFRAFLLGRLRGDVDAAALRDARARAAEAMLADARLDAAIDLFIEAQAWPRAVELIVLRAPTLLQDGRRETLAGFVRLLPGAVAATYPRVGYWLGVASMIDDTTIACAHFERSYMRLAEAGERPAMALAAAQAVLAIHMSWSTQVGAAPWLQRLEACAAAAADLPPGDRLRVATAVVRSAGMGAEYRVNETSVAAEVQRILTTLETGSSEIAANDRLIAADALQEHALITTTSDLFERTVAAATPYLADPALTPWAKCHWLISFGIASGRRWPYRKQGFPYASAEDALRDAWTIAQREGLQGLRFAATFNLVNVVRAKGDRSACEALVARLESEYDPAKPTQAVLFLSQKGTQLGWTGQYEAALVVQKAVEEAAARAQTPLSEQWNYRMGHPQMLIGLGRFDEASALAHEDAPLYSGVFRQAIEIIGTTAELLAARRDGAPDYVERLRACMREVAAMNWSNYMTAIPLIVSELWGDALEHGIETPFVTDAIRRRNLPVPLTYAPSWPWPLRVRVLGRLEIERDGTPLAFGTKTPKKPLELLKVLACTAARAVDVRQILAWLWPDADTDAAKAALDVATHRLRKFLGDDEALVLAGGKLQLSPERIWVDATAFASWLDEAQRQLDAKPGLPTANLLAERLYRDYRGRLFGDDEPTPWSIGPRERLHQKFLQLAGSLGRYHEVRRDWIRAAAVYERGLAEDQLAEELYRGLIRCHLARNEPAAALHAFRRCREILSVVLGVSPAPATMALVSKVRGASA